MPEAPRGFALNYIPLLIEEGLANTQIVNFLRSQGFGYRTQEMFADVNRVRLEGFGASFVTNLNPDAPVPERFMRTWEGNTEYNYRVVVKYEYIDPSTGIESTSGTAFYSNEPMSQNEVMDRWQIRKQSLHLTGSPPVPESDIIGTTQVLYYKNVASRGSGL